MRVREDPDFRIGQDKPADQIILEITFKRATERFLRQAPPCFTRNLIPIELPLHVLL